MRFLRLMSENDDRTAERFRAVDKPADNVEVVGKGVEGDGKAADEDGVEDGGVGVVEVVGEGVEGEGEAADEDGVGDGGVGVGGGEGGGRRTRLPCRMWLRTEINTYQKLLFVFMCVAAF